jgi:hypothetical protein
LIRKQKPLFLYRIQQEFKTAVVANIKESLVQQIAIKAHFLRISGYDIAKQAEIAKKLLPTKKSEQITSPFLIFVTLKDEIMRTLQNKRPINPNNKIMLKHQESEQLKY